MNTLICILMALKEIFTVDGESVDWDVVSGELFVHIDGLIITVTPLGVATLRIAEDDLVSFALEVDGTDVRLKGVASRLAANRIEMLAATEAALEEAKEAEQERAARALTYHEERECGCCGTPKGCSVGTYEAWLASPNKQVGFSNHSASESGYSPEEVFNVYMSYSTCSGCYDC